MGFYRNLMNKVAGSDQEQAPAKDDFKTRIDRRLEEIKANFKAQDSVPKLHLPAMEHPVQTERRRSRSRDHSPEKEKLVEDKASKLQALKDRYKKRQMDKQEQ